MKDTDTITVGELKMIIPTKTMKVILNAIENKQSVKKDCIDWLDDLSAKTDEDLELLENFATVLDIGHYNNIKYLDESFRKILASAKSLKNWLETKYD